MVELVRSGRSPEELSREFEPTAQTIHNWVKQTDLDAGLRSDGLTTEEREELRLLRRENKRLRMEQEILKKAAAGPTLRVGALLGGATRSRSGVRVREAESGCFFCSGDVAYGDGRAEGLRDIANDDCVSCHQRSLSAAREPGIPRPAICTTMYC